MSLSPQGYGVLRLNTNGSSLGNPSPSKFRGIIHDCMAKWKLVLLARATIHTICLHAELFTVYNGLKLT